MVLAMLGEASCSRAGTGHNVGQDARPSELLVCLGKMAPDGGKCPIYSQLCLVHEWLIKQVVPVADTPTS